MAFLGVYRALYDYTPQADNEIAITEGDILCVLEKGADDWWKAKKKASSNDQEEPEGLIPNNYVEEVAPMATAKAVYEYTRQTDEELSFPEDAVLEVFDTSDDDWTLVGLNGEYGFAPANYIEVEEEEAPPPMPSRPRPAAAPEPAPEPLSRRARTPSPPASPIQSPAAALAGIIQSKSNGSRGGLRRSIPSPPPAVTRPPRKQVQFTPEESDEEPPAPKLPQRRQSEQSSPRPANIHNLSVRNPGPSSAAGVLPSPPHNRVVSAVYDEDRAYNSPGGYHLYNIYEMIEVMGKNRKTPVTLGINIGKGIIMISSDQSKESKEWSADKIRHYSIEGKHVFMELIRPSRSIDFHAGAKDTAREIVSALGELAGAAKAEGALREVFGAGSGSEQKYGKILYDFKAAGDDEVSVKVDDEVIVIEDSKSSEWWMVRRIKNGKEGVVPSNYVEITGVVTTALSSSKGAKSDKSYVEKNRLEEERLARDSRGGSLEVGPGLQLPERGSSLTQNGNTRRSSQKSRRDAQDNRSSSDKKQSNIHPESRNSFQTNAK
jgi:actin cytoskeleton-regulatory complex protein SLA1